jgi:hypothetical protein
VDDWFRGVLQWMTGSEVFSSGCLVPRCSPVNDWFLDVVLLMTGTECPPMNDWFRGVLQVDV